MRSSYPQQFTHIEVLVSELVFSLPSVHAKATLVVFCCLYITITSARALSYSFNLTQIMLIISTRRRER